MAQRLTPLISLLLVPALAFGENVPFMRAIDDIVARDPRIEGSKAILDYSAVDVASHYGAFLPTLSLTGRKIDYTNQNTKVTTASGQANLNLWKFGADWAALNASGYSRQAAEAGVNQSVLNAEHEALSAILNYLQAQQLFEISERLTAIKKESLHITERRFDRGSVPQSEVLKARVDHANAISRTRGLKIALESARAPLRLLLGHSDVLPEWPWKNRLFMPGAQDFFKEEEKTEDLSALRPDLKQYRFQAMARDYSASESFRDMFPRLDFGVERGLTDYERGLRNFETTATLTLSIPLFEGLSDYRNYRARDTDRIVALTTFERARRDATSSVETLKQNYREALATAIEREEILQLSRRLYRDNVVRFGTGRVDFNELVIDQNRYLQSEELYTEGMKNVHQAFGELCLAYGKRLRDCVGPAL